MLYRIRSTGAVKNQGAIRKLFPNVSLPRVWNKDVCDFLKIDPVLESPQPPITELQSVYEDGVKQDANGNWVKAWIVTNKFSDYTKENEDGTTTTVTKEEQEAAFLAKKTADKAAAIRAERDKKLVETDWMGMSDVTMSDDWKTYRQALRDVTGQDTFPESVTWPTKPE